MEERRGAVEKSQREGFFVWGRWSKTDLMVLAGSTRGGEESGKSLRGESHPQGVLFQGGVGEERFRKASTIDRENWQLEAREFSGRQVGFISRKPSIDVSSISTQSGLGRHSLG